jgi:hypothetical protein
MQKPYSATRGTLQVCGRSVTAGNPRASMSQQTLCEERPMYLLQSLIVFAVVASISLNREHRHPTLR